MMPTIYRRIVAVPEFLRIIMNSPISFYFMFALSVTRLFYLLLLCALLVAHSDSQASWVWDEPFPQGNALVSVAASTEAAILIAVGDYGAVVRKTSSGNWTAVPNFTSGQALASVCWSGSRFLAVGPDAGLWESSDGLVWNRENSNVSGNTILAANNLVLCVGSTALWVSSNDGPFQQVQFASIGLESPRAVVASNQKFLAVHSNGALLVSENGTTWSATQPVANGLFFAAAGGPNGFLVGGIKPNGTSYLPVLYRSSNGTTWSEMNLPANGNYIYRLMESAGGWLLDEFVNSAESIYRRGIFHRFDGSAWQQLTNIPAAFVPYASIALTAEDTVIVGDRGMLSLMGSNSSIVAQGNSTFSSEVLEPARFAAAGLENKIVAIDKNVSRADNARYYSTSDGHAWSQASPAPLKAISALASHNGTLTAFSVFNPSAPRGFYKLVDQSWVPLSSADEAGLDAVPLDASVVSFAATPDASVGVLLSRAEFFSPNGSYVATRGLYRGSQWKDWTPVALPEARLQQPPAGEILESVVWDGSRFVLLLHPGRIFTSTDGVSWNQLPPLPSDSKAKLIEDYPGLTVPAENIAISVSSNGSRLVARAAKLNPNGTHRPLSPAFKETFYIFEQGRWWPLQVSKPVLPSRRQIIHDGARFLAIGDEEILSSTDGFAWASHPIPATAVSLLSTGSRLVAFTDSFGILSTDQLGEGNELDVPSLDPLVKPLQSFAQSYTVQLNMPGQSWTVGGVPNWMTVSPSSGNGSATLTVQVSKNTGSSARGAVLQIGSLPHIVGQQSAAAPLTLAAKPTGSTITIPFSGNWSASSSSSLISFPKGATVGSGHVKLTLPANTTSDSREFTVNLNGVNFKISQAAAVPAILRAGTYSGLIGKRGTDPDATLSDWESYDGSVSIVLGKASRSAPHGVFTASLSLFQNGTISVFKSRGLVNANGTITGNWVSSGKSPLTATISLSILNESSIEQSISGTLSLVGSETPLALFAGKKVFDAKSNPLPADASGKATFFIASFGEQGNVADTAIASASLLPKGTARMVGTRSDGSKFSASSVIWGAAGPALSFPVFLSDPKSASLLAGFLLRNPLLLSSDWSGPLNKLVASGILQLNGSLSNYSQPARGASSVVWNAPARFTLNTAALFLVAGNASLTAPGQVAVDFDAPDSLASLKINPATGLVSGQYRQLTPGFKPLTLLGAVNQKIEALNGSRGSVLGFAPKSPGDTFSIQP